MNGVSDEQAKHLLRTGRVPGAWKIGKRGFWIIPKDSPYPEDDRCIGRSYKKK